MLKKKTGKQQQQQKNHLKYFANKFKSQTGDWGAAKRCENNRQTAPDTRGTQEAPCA